MDIAIIPNWLIKYLSKGHVKQNNLNILISNLLIILIFLICINSIIGFLGHIPHFCIIDKIIGVECPVCGTTRAFCELSKGNLTNAYMLNTTSLLVALFFIAQIPLRLVALTNENKSKTINIISKYASRGVLTIIMLNWIFNLSIIN